MSVYFRRRCCHPSVSSRSPRGRRQMKIDNMMEGTSKCRRICSCWMRPTSHLLSKKMQQTRLKRFLSLSNRGHHWEMNSCLNCFESTSNYQIKQAGCILQQSQKMNQHQPSVLSALLPSPHQEERFIATTDQLRESRYWPNCIPLLVAFVFVISDIVVLLALVFHLVESSPLPFFQSPLIKSSPVSVNALILSPLPPYDQVTLLLPPDDHETYDLRCLHPLLLSASANDGTLFFISILDSALLFCALLCRLIRTSSIWLRQPKSKFHHGSYSFSSDWKTNLFFRCVRYGKGKFNGDGNHAGNLQINVYRSIHLDCNHIQRNRKCDVTWCDWRSWLWSWNESLDVGRADFSVQSLSRRQWTNRQGCFQWICKNFQWQWRSNRTDSNGVGYDQSETSRFGLHFSTSSLPMLVEKKKSTLSIEHPLFTFGRRRAVPKASSTLSSSCLVVVLLLSSFSSFAVSSSTPSPAFQSVPQSSPASALVSDRLPMTDSLNPWLSADGGLILRAATGNTPNSSPLNWIRPNPGSCIPQPAIPACPSDRYCRLPESAGRFSVNGRPFSVTFDHESSSTLTDSLNKSGSSNASNRVGSSKGDFKNDQPLFDTARGNNGKREGSGGTEEEEEKWSGRGVTADDGGLRNVDAAVAKVSQCLPYLKPSRSQQSNGRDEEPSSAECICGHADGAKRVDTLRKYHLHHCYHYSLWHVLSDTEREGIAMSRSQCYAYLEDVERLDNLAAHFVCQFEDIIRRYDCGQTFSSKSSCQQCKIAYRQWVCSMVLPMWLDGDRIKPCRTFCHEVERLCPYFLPAEKSGPGSQYAGEPSFLCIDPDVRETTNQSANSAYSERSCYRPCTLEYNLEPDIDPSLCVASLGDISGFVEEDVTNVIADREDCQQTHKNETASVSGFVEDSELLDDSEVSDDQCTPFLDRDPPLTSRMSSSGTNHFHFGWRWRTLVLPFAMLPSVIQYFT